MNERIKKLWDDAALEAGDESNTWDGQVAFMALFAELIVRECVQVAIEQKEWVKDMKTHNPHDEEWNRARIQQSQHIVDKIKQHFGVE